MWSQVSDWQLFTSSRRHHRSLAHNFRRRSSAPCGALLLWFPCRRREQPLLYLSFFSLRYTGATPMITAHPFPDVIGYCNCFSRHPFDLFPWLHAPPRRKCSPPNTQGVCSRQLGLLRPPFILTFTPTPTNTPSTCNYSPMYLQYRFVTTAVIECICVIWFCEGTADLRIYELGNSEGSVWAAGVRCSREHLHISFNRY